jgi:signal transduction histidine kinase
MKRNMKIFLFLLALFLFSETSVYPHQHAVQGVLDLRELGFKHDPVYSLDGTWEFYWEQLFTPDTFLSIAPPVPDLFGKVPSYWTEYSLKGQKLHEFGYCSYRLIILLPSGFYDELVVSVPVFDSSFKLFIDGKSYGGNGKVGKSPETSEAGYKPFLATFKPQSDTLEILIQTSNYQHRRGGFWKQMTIGLEDQVIKKQQQYIFTSYVSMGVLLAFSLFFFFFFLFYRKDILPLLFSVFVFGILIRLICTGIYPVTLLTDISWDWMVRIEYMGVYLAGIAGTWFFHSLYPLKFMKPVNIANSLILLIFCVFIPFTHANIFAYSMIYFQYAAILYILLYFVYGFITIYTKGTSNLVYFSANLIFFLALLNDIGLANSKRAITWDYTLHIAVQIFIFIHAVMIIRTWIKAYIEKERLHKEIEYLNTNLEKIISERTLKLQERNRLVVVQNEKIASQNDQLKNEIDFKNRVFSIIAHDLRSPISSLIQFFDVMKENVAKNVRDAALNSIHHLAISTSYLIENLLFWGRSQGNQIHVNNRDTDTTEIVNNVIELFKETAEKKSISLSFQKEGNCIAFCDPELMQIVLRNLVSNAIKFTNEKGIISIQVVPFADDKSFILVSVTDTGLGIPEENLKILLSGQNPESTYGTAREKGTGLGLRICFDLVRLTGGKIDIKNQVDKGTKVTILLPVGE